jgi:hypothetical protein
MFGGPRVEQDAKPLLHAGGSARKAGAYVIQI